ncbi:CPBP family intramembrane glutamic endopeptidase [Actinocorallia sp. A-T 12471]|uniref:CPBP family intramembrane glutamic endopeptidase n=1 Tax=Actinocorallia sp. A-T 12471 TaxID=3089813 RepID=UPI0029CBA247|nr:CPBP family intramembrane glutamic endopeptidase [Actinocorallia sp. A-T 12471]MDX6741938.1 CPBP family intramembrane glutamic endopeptidase [Actinocorallia sp. A-T 12471]
MEKRSRTKGIVVFLAISFGGTWIWLFFATAVLGLSPLNPLLQLPAACMPALAAVVVRSLVTREGYRDAGLRLNLRRSWPYYLAAWIGPAGVAVATLALAALVGLWHPDLSGPGGFLPGSKELLSLGALMLVALVLTPLYLGEEFGWTGYLRPRLYGGRPLPSTIATGLIWAVWHFPLAFIGYVEFPDLLVGLLIWTISFQLQEVILTWLYTRSGSIWTSGLAHAGNNMVLFFILGELLDTGADLGPTWPMALSLAPMALISLWITTTRKLTPTHP